MLLTDFQTVTVFKKGRHYLNIDLVDRGMFPWSALCNPPMAQWIEVTPYDPEYIVEKGDCLVWVDGEILVVDGYAGKKWKHCGTEKLHLCRILSTPKSGSSSPVTTTGDKINDVIKISDLQVGMVVLIKEKNKCISKDGCSPNVGRFGFTVKVDVIIQDNLFRGTDDNSYHVSWIDKIVDVCESKKYYPKFTIDQLCKGMKVKIKPKCDCQLADNYIVAGHFDCIVTVNHIVNAQRNSFQSVENDELFHISWVAEIVSDPRKEDKGITLSKVYEHITNLDHRKALGKYVNHVERLINGSRFGLNDGAYKIKMKNGNKIHLDKKPKIIKRSYIKILSEANNGRQDKR